ncbi:hypothetical protein [Bdellovibrio sp.]|uniref:hypothetical protein n=1 Tax=Bdellovibrio sp. TaxID=28201 RepID=UPI0039E68496
MRLLLQEYLLLLKEDNELDVVTLELATAMGLTIVSAPQKGVRQDGVDIHAIGVDPEDGIKKNFLITIKKGDIDRAVWDVSKQGVRSSLNEIIDVYIPNKISVEDRKLPSKIILCCGGELKQEVQTNWTGYQNNHSTVQFDLWNASKLSSLIEENLLNEGVFLESTKKKMRRCLVVLSDHEYDLAHYKETLNDLLFGDDWKDLAAGAVEKRALKVLSTISVCLGMIYEYSKDADDFKHPLIAAEHTLLRCWDFILKNNLQDNTKVTAKFYHLLHLYYKYGADYFIKIEPHLLVRDGASISCGSHVLASEVVFQQIGIISILGLSQAIWAISAEDPQGIENSKIVLNGLKNLISNNGISGSPCFDGMTIDITLAITFLALCGENDFIKNWINEIIRRFHFSYVVLERGFPISQDSIEMLVEFEKEKEHTKEKMTSMSTLLATLAYFCAVLDFEDQYNDLVKFVEDDLSHCNLQIWFPAKGIKAQLYSRYAGVEFGIAEAPIHLPKTLSELKDRLVQFSDFSNKSENFETDWKDSPPALPLIASRHFRTPVIPFFWLNFKKEDLKGVSEKGEAP